MKKTLVAAFLVFLALSGLVAKEKKEIEPFRIYTPRTTGYGNAYVAVARGFETLWTNPAGFTDKEWELNILGLDVSGLGRYEEIMDFIDEGADTSDTGALLTSMSDLMTGSGAGANVGTGISWVGKRLGLGVYDSLMVYMQGDPFPAGVEGYADNSLAFIGGYAHPFHLTDSISLSAGIALRPTLKYRVEIDGKMIEDIISQQDDFDGAQWVKDKMSHPAFGVPIDLGVKATFPFGLSAAMTAKDLFATYTGSGVPYDYYTNWSYNVGGAWNPKVPVLSWLVDPTIAVEFSNLNRVIAGDTGFWRQFHLGLELAMLKDFLTVWGGFDGGYPALGTSVDLFFMDISAAYGTTEYGRYLGDRPVSNFTVEVSFRLD